MGLRWNYQIPLLVPLSPRIKSMLEYVFENLQSLIVTYVPSLPYFKGDSLILSQSPFLPCFLDLLLNYAVFQKF